MSDTKDSGTSEPTISPTRISLVHGVLVDPRTRSVVDIYLTPSYQEMEKIIGSSFWVPFRFNDRTRDRIFADEGHFNGYEDFWLDGHPISGCALIVGVDEFHSLVDTSTDIVRIAGMVRWNDAGKKRKTAEA